MVAKDDWGSESMTAINAAITAGNGYTASVINEAGDGTRTQNPDGTGSA